MNIREALPTPVPQQVFYRPQPVFIRHPGCDVPLLSFPALSTDTAGHYGVSRPLVLNACRVLTNHVADYSADFLATDIQGRNRLSIDDTPLDVDCYYFLGLPDLEASRDYPIVKTFAAFTFPRTLPDDWARVTDAWQRPSHTAEEPPHASSMSSNVKRRDTRCAVTKYPDGTQCAHLVPPSEKRWFVANRMTVYAPDNVPAGVDGPANGVLLRADVRACFDAHGFVFYPAPADDRRCGFVAYVVRGGCAYLPDVLHRRRVEMNRDVPVEYVYARFAYAVIHLPRDNDLFESVGGLEREELEELKENENERERGSVGNKATHERNDGFVDRTTHSAISGGENDAERDRRWRELLFGRIPELSELPEVEHPPETFTGCHAETPHMLRLSSEYMKRNPQVWQTSATAGTDATREDVEGFYADLLTRPT